MRSVGPQRPVLSTKVGPDRGWRIISIIASASSVVLLLVVFGAKLQRFQVSAVLLVTLILTLCTVVFVHVRFLLHLHQQHR